MKEKEGKCAARFRKEEGRAFFITEEAICFVFKDRNSDK